MKKMTAQGPCSLPIPSQSIVPIVTPQHAIDPSAKQNSNLGGFGYPTLVACASTHLKTIKNINARKEELKSMTYLKGMSCGQCVAVSVTVACGQGGSQPLETAMQYEQNGVMTIAGTINQMMGFKLSFPNIFVFINLYYRYLIKKVRQICKYSKVIPVQISCVLNNKNEQNMKQVKIQIKMQNKMRSEAETIKALYQKLDIKQKQNLNLQRRLDQSTTSLTKNEKIIRELQAKLAHMQQQTNKIRQELSKKEVLIKTYQDNLYNKNVHISSLEKQHQLKAHNIASEKTNKIVELQTIIGQQEEEISKLMSDHRLMLDTFRQVQYVNRMHIEQRQLLKNFNSELQTQIEEVDNQNQVILSELQETRAQLQLQNQQGEDLLCQIGAMAQHLQASNPVLVEGTK